MHILNHDVCTLLSGFCAKGFYVLEKSIKFLMEWILSYVDMQFVYLYSVILFYVLDRASRQNDFTDWLYPV